MSTFFQRAQNTSISGGVFSHVQGDQYNDYTGRAETRMITSSSANGRIAANQGVSSPSTTTTMVVNVRGNQVNQIIQREDKEHTEFDDYRHVKSGDFCRLENVCVVKRRYDMLDVDKTVCAAKVIGTEDRFTSVTYRGPDARRAFEKDFRKFSRARSSAQVFAVDVGTVPSLLFWHGLLPISHFGRGLGWLGGTYIYTLCRKLNCLEEELWVDSGRGVFCQGPEGPMSNIGWMEEEVEAEELPLTTEMLQEDVFSRFLASLKSREADWVFLHAMSWDSNYVGVPELVDQPTIFSTLTKTPIAVANNAWTSRRVFTERKVLENGITRFRLEEDGTWLSLDLNENAELAWLSQSSNIFQSCGISLDDDLSVYGVVYSQARLEGSLDPSPPKPQRRRQQPIYIFVYSPPPDLFNGKTLRLHFWSFHEDGQHRLSPELCLDFGLPIELQLWHLYKKSRKNIHHKLIHQYQLLRGFNPRTTDFVQHVGYGHIFQPIHHSDRFMEVSQEHSDSSECLSDMMDEKLALDPTYMTNNQAQIKSGEAGLTSNTDLLTSKRQRRIMGYEGIARNDPEPDLRHKNNATNGHDPAMDGHNSRLVQPLRPTRFRPFPYPVNSHPPIPLNYSHPPQGHQSQLHPPSYHNNPPPYPYPSHPTSPSLGHVPFASRVENMSFPTTSDLSSTHLQSRGWPELSQNSAAPTYFNASPPFHAYNSGEIANSASDLTRSTIDLGYTASGAYLGVSTIANAPRYDLGATQNTGWSGASQVATYVPMNMSYTSPAYPATSYSTPAVTHPFNAAYSANVTYSPPSATATSHAHDPGYPSPFPFYGGGSFAPQQTRNLPVAHHDSSYDPSSFSSEPGASYPSDSTVHAQSHLSFSAHTPQGHPSMLSSNGVPHQPWNTPADHTQQYSHEPSMQSIQPNTWNEASGEYGQGDGSSGWQ
ncbi:hypothetical protein PQX77_002045 [Marasmius sp. AFHP31]|nr:hypothetical protein PQX77_002045 [Marasmius sp. AFHP31]